MSSLPAARTRVQASKVQKQMPGILITAPLMLAGPPHDMTHDAAVLMDGRLIVAAGPRRVVQRIAGDAVRLSFPGCTLLPGLVDAHVHLVFDASPDPAASLRAGDVGLVFTGMADRAYRLLASGVTTARDLGDWNGLAGRLREQIRDGVLPGPRILTSGAPITSVGGHCWFLGGEVHDADQIRMQVLHCAEQGADLIKVMVTGGRLTPTGPAPWDLQFSAPQLRTAVLAAKELGLKVAAHVHSTEGIRMAIDAGVHSLEHCRWLTRDGVTAPKELIDKITDREIFVCPTINVNWHDLAARVGAKEAEDLVETMSKLYRNGVALIAGTDAGIPDVDVADYAAGLTFFPRLGMSTAEVIELATVRAAAALGLADRAGRIAPGMAADLLVVNGNPLASLTALRSVRAVVADGRLRVVRVPHGRGQSRSAVHDLS